MLNEDRAEPLLFGDVTGGPPLSLQQSFNLSASESFHVNCTRPVVLRKAPYFTAFVASSCSASVTCRDMLALSEVSGPSIVNRSTLEGLKRGNHHVSQRRTIPFVARQEIVGLAQRVQACRECRPFIGGCAHATFGLRSLERLPGYS